MRRREILGLLLDQDTGRAFRGDAMSDDGVITRRQLLDVVRRAENDKWKRRERMRLVAAVCIGVVLAAGVAALVFEVLR